MDTKPLETEAESLVKSELIKFGFNVVKPTFDIDGADLLIIDTIKEKFTHFLRIQCKGRSVHSNGSNVSIPSEYVDDNFVLFLYLKLENYKTRLAVFFAEDIIEWNKRNNKYILTFTKKSIESDDFKSKEFGYPLSQSVKETLRKTKIKKYTSVIIDSIFLNKAIRKTIDTYQKIYPEKTFITPKLVDVIKIIILYYDNFNITDKNINIIYVFNPEVFQPVETLDINSAKFLTDKGTECKLSIDEIDGFVKFEILEYLERTVNNENIILVADDILYEDSLNKFKDKGVEVTLFQFKSSDGRQMYTMHYWGDIILPLGRAIGLDEYEL